MSMARIFSYNCGGFALGTDDWYFPGRLCNDGDDYEMLEYSFDDNEEAFLHHLVDLMLEEFEGYLRIVESEHDIEDDEVVVFFRIGAGDFHFITKEPDGKYWHKMGEWDIEEIEEEEVYSDCWCCRYDSEMIIFAYKKAEYLELLDGLYSSWGA